MKRGASKKIKSLKKQKHAKVDATEHEIKTPWYEINSYPHSPEDIQNILASNADINALYKDGDSLLLWAIRKYLPADTIISIVEHGAQVDVYDRHGDTPLHLVCDNFTNLAEAVQIMIAHGAKTDALNNQNEYPLHLAIERSLRINQIAPAYLEILRHLCKDVINPDDAEVTPPIYDAIKSMGRSINSERAVKLLEILISEGALDHHSDTDVVAFANNVGTCGEIYPTLFNALFAPPLPQLNVPMCHASDPNEKRKIFFLLGPDMHGYEELAPGAPCIRFELSPVLKSLKKKYARNDIETAIYGDGKINLTKQHLSQFFKDITAHKGKSTVVILAHGIPNGSPKRYDDRHLTSFGKQDTNTATFFEQMAQAVNGRPIDIFSVSCYGGLMQDAAQRLLPYGSTYASLSVSTADKGHATLFPHIAKAADLLPLSAHDFLMVHLTRTFAKSISSCNSMDPNFSSSGQPFASLRENLIQNLGKPFTNAQKQKIHEKLSHVPKQQLEQMMSKINAANNMDDFNDPSYGLALAICFAAKDFDYKPSPPILHMNKRQSKDAKNDAIVHLEKRRSKRIASQKK